LADNNQAIRDANNEYKVTIDLLIADVTTL
jgi:hypothetical protein